MLIKGKVENQYKINAAIYNLFWAMLRLNHPELNKIQCIGMADGYQLVELPVGKTVRFSPFSLFSDPNQEKGDEDAE